MDNIEILDTVTRLDIPAGRVIDGAKEADLETALVIGWDEDGEFYFASSKADGGCVLWLLELAKKELMGDDD